jgi:MFS transporter, FHS family, glucose/mannose:H+ symporter
MAPDMIDNKTNKTAKNDNIKDYSCEFPNFLSLFIRPIFFISLSPILLEVSATLNTNIRDLNLIFTFFTIGYLAGNLSSIFYNRKFRKLHIIIFSYLILVIINLVLSLERTLHAYYLLYLLGGYTLGIIWIQANELILESRIENKVRLNMIALSFFPLGTIIAPFIATVVISSKLSWWYSYYVIIVMLLVIIILYLTITRKKIDNNSVRTQEHVVFKGIFTDKNKNKIIILRVIMTLLYTIPVTILITWFPTFFRIEKMFSYQEAGLTVTIFYASMILGRIIITLLDKKIKLENLILIFVFVSFVSLIFMVFSSHKYIIFISEAFAGIGFAGTFPFLITSVSMIYEKGRGLLLTILFSAEGIGAALAPYLTALISKYNMTFSVSLSILVSFVIFILFIVDLIFRKRFKTSDKFI